jgi:hypothetical protein
MKPRLIFGARILAAGAAVVMLVLPLNAAASAIPSGERMEGNSAIEPAYNDFNGTFVFLHTPRNLAPLNAKDPMNHVNNHAVAPLYLVVYPPNTPGIFNCMGVPGNCPDHDGPIAGVATSVMPAVYGTNPLAVPGHDHLVGMPHTGDWNFAWHVYVELFTSSAAVTHITTLGGLQQAWTSGGLVELDSGITFGCSSVSESSYWKATPLG